jgi:hypothetical protein
MARAAVMLIPRVQEIIDHIKYVRNLVIQDNRFHKIVKTSPARARIFTIKFISQFFTSKSTMRARL